MATATLQRTNISLLSLFCSANFDKDRIVIADYELSENFLTLYLEDKYDFKESLEDTVMFKLPVSKFAEIITQNNLNSYEQTLFTERGRPYEGRVIINTPLEWFNDDATPYEQNYTIETVKNCLLKSLTTAGGK